MGTKLVQGDHNRTMPLKITLDGKATDITDCEIRVTLLVPDTDILLVKEATVTNGPKGECTILLSGDDLAFAGAYQYQATVRNTNMMTFSSGIKNFLVTPALEGNLLGLPSYELPAFMKGEKGDLGPRGFQGDTGPRGLQGLKGDTGIQGVVGPQGLKGDIGNTGPQGIQGVIGPQGIVGPQGLKGDTGAVGPVGPATSYTWIKYGTSAAGAGMSDSPTGMTHIGIASNKTTATKSNTASDYTWALIQGPKGDTGTGTLVTNPVLSDDTFVLESTEPPKEVEYVTIANPTTTSFDVVFPDKVTLGDAVSYKVYQNNVLKGTITARQDVLVTFPLTGLTVNTSYTIKVTAVNAAGIESTGVTVTGKTNGTATMTTGGGAGSYLTLKSMLLTRIEVSCEMDSVNGGGYLIESGGTILSRNGLASVRVMEKPPKEVTINGFIVKDFSPMPTGVLNISFEIEPTQTTSRLFILGKTRVNFVKVFNGNTLIASHDFTVNPSSNTIPDLSGNGNTANLVGGVWT